MNVYHRLKAIMHRTPPVTEPVIDIGWRSLGDHTVVIMRQANRYGYRLYINNNRGRFVKCLHNPICFDSEREAVEAARAEAQEQPS